MHPIFGHKGRLLIYLAAWQPAAALLAALLVFAGGFGWTQAFAIAVPMMLGYAFLGLAAWYICRAFPLGSHGVLKLAGVHLLAAILTSSLWLLMSRGMAAALMSSGALGEVGTQLQRQAPLLFTVGILLFFLASAGGYLMAAFEQSREAERRALELQILAREAELKALKAKVDPHFLFNSLNSISALTSANAAGARRMCELLADFLRKSLALGERELVPFALELDLVQKYVAIEQVRLGSRLEVTMEIGEGTADFPVPPLLLQPLLENAVNHGIARLLDGGEVKIEARMGSGRLVVFVENPTDPDADPVRGQGIGLTNLRSRLRNIYGREASLAVKQNSGHFRVVLALPARDA